MFLVRMAAFKSSTVARTLERKLGAIRSDGGKHIKFHIYDDASRLVARTEMSRGWSVVDDDLMSMLAHELHVRRPFWVELCRCLHDRSAYLSAVS